MKYTKLSAAAALAAGSALILSACAPGGGDDADNTASSGNGGASGSASQGGEAGAPEVTEGDKGQKLTAPVDGPGMADLGDVETQDGSIAYSVGADDFLSYNGLQSNTYTTYNSAVADRMFSSFWYFGTDGSIIPNKDFGTYEKTSDDPLTVKYTISDDAKWSDGTPVTAGDFIVHWAANNDTVKAEGSETPLFDSISFEQGKYIPEAPEGEADGKEFTVTYPEPYADWEILISTALPAHIVAKEAGMSFEELVTAAKEKDVEALAAGVHLSAGHLSRRFREEFGESPYSYLMTRRIERAMTLLRSTDRSVTDICLDVGFSSLGTFSTRFKELDDAPAAAASSRSASNVRG